MIHNNQQNTHRRLLKDLDISIHQRKCLKDLGMGKFNNYDLFRIWKKSNENGSRGTDHGMAAPHFIIENLKGGIIGNYENLVNYGITI